MDDKHINETMHVENEDSNVTFDDEFLELESKFTDANFATYDELIKAKIGILEKVEDMKKKLNLQRKCFSDKINYLMTFLKKEMELYHIVSFPLSISKDKYTVQLISEENANIDFDIMDQVIERAQQKKSEREPLNLGDPILLAESVISNMTSPGHIGNNNTCYCVEKNPRYDFMNNIIKDDTFFYVRVVKKKKPMSLKKMEKFFQERSPANLYLEFEEKYMEEFKDKNTEDVIASFFTHIKTSYDEHIDIDYDIELSKFDINNNHVLTEESNTDRNSNEKLYHYFSIIIDAIFILKKKIQLLKTSYDYLFIKMIDLPVNVNIAKYLTNTNHIYSKSYEKFMKDISENEELMKAYTQNYHIDIGLAKFARHIEDNSISFPFVMQSSEKSAIKLYQNFSSPPLNSKFFIDAIQRVMVNIKLNFSGENIHQIMMDLIKYIPNLKKNDSIITYKFGLLKANHFAHIKYRKM